MKPATAEAYQLMHDGSLALAEMEANGMKVDVEYLKKAMNDVERKADRIEQKHLHTDPLWKTWRKKFKDKANITSRDQLAQVLLSEGLMKTDRDAKITKGGRYSADRAALDRIDHPFVRYYISAEKLRNVRRTFMMGVLKETSTDDLLHPFFNLNIATSYRSSSDSPNVQNIPIRDPEMASIIRRAFIPRAPDRCIVEIDFSGIEVRVSACYNKDPVLIKYIEDPSTDMHRDMAAEIYKVKKRLIEKNVRHAAKNQFVFPEFYGSYYKQCAPALWEAIDRNNFQVDGVPMKKHLKKKGILSRGDCDPDCRDAPLPGTFEAHLRNVERDFWGSRFVVYRDWKQSYFEQYVRRCGCQTLTGFVIDSILNKKEVSNYPIQGSAFHCLLWSVIRIVRNVRKKKIDAKVNSQIHDSVLSDVHVDHVADYVAMAVDVMTRQIQKHWDWIIVPLAVEAEVSPAGESWLSKAKYELN